MHGKMFWNTSSASASAWAPIRKSRRRPAETAVSPSLAESAIERLAGWQTLQELAGVVGVTEAADATVLERREIVRKDASIAGRPVWLGCAIHGNVNSVGQTSSPGQK